MTLATWNVLHRIHAENWIEAAVLERFPDEAVRIETITHRIKTLLHEDEDTCVCLQEVSGDQLTSLVDALPLFAVCSFAYPRLPRLKQEGPSPLEDTSEHLVTIARRATQLAAEAFQSDPGKGCLAVAIGDTIVVNTHVSFGSRREKQIARAAALAGSGRSAVCGDFNATAEQVLNSIGSGFLPCDLGSGAAPTRPCRESPDVRLPAIDHIMVRGIQGAEGTVVDVACESDHNLVRAHMPER